jgi:hypothetical protein
MRASERFLRAVIRAMETDDPELARVRLNAAVHYGKFKGLCVGRGRPRKERNQRPLPPAKPGESLAEAVARLTSEGA